MKRYLNKRNLTRARNDLKDTNEKSIEIRNSDIKSILKVWSKLQKNKINKYDEFYNVCLYSSIVTRDISMLWNDYSLTDNETKKNLYGRLLSMTIIEFLDDINGLLGRNLRIELESNNMSEFISELNDVNKKFSTVKKQNNKELRLIRNNSAAHKSKKAKDLINFTENIHFENLHKISVEVSEANIQLNKLTTEVIYKINERINIEHLRKKVIQ
ncbi:hypothetical protein H3Z83_04210 [Tenacibaculum sp. S7007]|uniref:HEPN AbiU2-like domain-containing protein n=1 Tax=Tenacibaculum pelagium TaxID=2759527 RepID=A0A839AMV8_9FLAO|nr:hypothetical protein [Tenacibaculum pelagium]MBA6155728.1 hypothetical protein [Tenacibaculum pelagium]